MNSSVLQSKRVRPSAQILQAVLFLLLIVVVVLMTLATYFQPGTHLVPGLDSSWAYGINYLTHKQMVMGRDAYFTFGPVGFLEHTRLLSDGMVYFSTVFWVVATLIMQTCLLLLAWRSNSHWIMRVLNFVGALALMVVAYPEIQRLLLLGYVLVCLHWQKRTGLLAIVLGLVAAVCLAIKFSYGAATLALVIPYFLLDVWRSRSGRHLLLALITCAVGLMVIWWMVYGVVEGIPGYLRGGLEFSQGSATAMAVNPDNNWQAIIAFYLTLLVAAVIFGREYHARFIPLSLAFGGPLYIWTKYAFGLEDASHIAFLLSFSFFVLATWVLMARDAIVKCCYAVMIVCGYLAWLRIHTVETGPPNYSFLPQIHFSTEKPFRIKQQLDAMLAEWRKTETERLDSLRLSPALREKIGNSTVDIYPWEAIIAEANHLNWIPRPVFQNYISYTPFLDGKNRDFFESKRAPDYLVWHYHSFQDIMNRYPFSSDPLTLESILRSYTLVQCEGFFCLWQRTDIAQLSSPTAGDVEVIQWDEWIPVPAFTSDILRAQLTTKRGLLGKLNLFAWKEGGVTIDYRLMNGEIKTHTLIIDNARSGLWAAPYIDRFDKPAAPPQKLTPEQLAQGLALPAAEGYVDKVEEGLGGQLVGGWALIPFLDTRQQQQKLVLYNQDSAWLVSAKRYEREGISEHFGKKGLVDLDQCGFKEIVSNEALPAGQYRVRFAVVNGEQRAITPDRDVLVNLAAHSALHNNVEAIRLHSTKPWAYSGPMRIEWQQLQFTGNPPWRQ